MPCFVLGMFTYTLSFFFSVSPASEPSSSLQTPIPKHPLNVSTWNLAGTLNHTWASPPPYVPSLPSPAILKTNRTTIRQRAQAQSTVVLLNPFSQFPWATAATCQVHLPCMPPVGLLLITLTSPTLYWHPCVHLDHCKHPRLLLCLYLCLHWPSGFLNIHKIPSLHCSNLFDRTQTPMSTLENSLAGFFPLEKHNTQNHITQPLHFEIFVSENENFHSNKTLHYLIQNYWKNSGTSVTRNTTQQFEGQCQLKQQKGLCSSVDSERVDHPRLFRWARWDHKVLKSREGDRRESERDTATEKKNGQRDENLLALKTEEGAMGL